MFYCPLFLVHRKSVLTVLGICSRADKFGNVYVLRTAPGTVDDIDDDPTGSKAVWQRGLMGGAPQKVGVICRSCPFP